MARRYAAGDVRLRPCLAQQLAGPSAVPIDVNRPEGATRRSFLRSGALTTLGLWFGGLWRPARGVAARAPRREGGRGRHPAAHKRRLLGVRRLAAARDGPPLERVAERVHERHAHQRLRADDALDRGARGPRRRRRAATSGRGSWPRACARRRRSGHRAGRPTRHANPRSETQLHAPGWVSSIARRDSSMHLSVDPKVARALYYAWRAREQLSCRPRPLRLMVAVRALGRQLAVLPLPEHPAEPDQLRRRDPGLRGQHDRRPDAAAARLPAPADALPARREARRAAVAHPEPGAELQLPPQPVPARGRRSEHRVGRVRQHRARRPLLLRAGAGARDEADLRGARAHAARLRAALAVRLLDAQRLPELGHRPVPVPLAPVALLGVVVPGPAGDRQLEELRPRRRAPLGEAHVRPLALASTSASPSAGTTTAASRAAACTASRPSSARAGTSSWPGSRRWPPRRSCAAWATTRPRSRRRCTRSTPRSAGSRSPRRPTTRRSWRSATAPSPTGASTSRAGSTRASA